MRRPGALRESAARVRSEIRVWLPYGLIAAVYVVALSWTGVVPSSPAPAALVAGVGRGLSATSPLLLVGLLHFDPGALQPFLVGTAWVVVGAVSVLSVHGASRDEPCWSRWCS